MCRVHVCVMCLILHEWESLCVNVRIRVVLSKNSFVSDLIGTARRTSRVNPMTLKHCSTESNCSL